MGSDRKGRARLEEFRKPREKEGRSRNPIALMKEYSWELLVGAIMIAVLVVLLWLFPWLPGSLWELMVDKDGLDPVLQ